MTTPSSRSSSSHDSAPGADAPRRKSWAWLVVLGAIAISVGAFFVLRPKAPETPAGMGGMGGMGAARRAGAMGGRPSPVTTVTAKKAELNVYVSALGSVTPLNTATVRSRADGELLKLHFTEGQQVKAGDLLAEIDPRSYQVALQQAEGQLQRNRASLENARLDLTRYESAREAVTQQQIDAARSTVAQLEGTVKGDEGSVASYRLQLSYCRVVAPIDGRVGLRKVDVGNLVRASDTTGLVVITQEQPIAVVFSIPEDSLSAVSKAHASGATIAVEAYDRGMKEKLAVGRLVAIDNQIDVTTGTVKIKAVFPNEDRSLFPNQFVNVRVLVSAQKDAIVVPSSSIQVSGQNRFVFAVIGGETVERRAVVVGASEGENVAIIKGVNPGEPVVVEGLDRLQDGAKVMPRERGAAAVEAPTGAPGARKAGGPAGAPGSGMPAGKKKEGTAPKAP